MATSAWASCATRCASSGEASPQSAATSTAAAASQASPLAMVKARALSGRLTRPDREQQVPRDPVRDQLVVWQFRHLRHRRFSFHDPAKEKRR